MATNYDEARVPHYTLPDPLRLQDGQRVTDAQTWLTRRRPELLDLFASHVYGRSPARPPVRAQQLQPDSKVLAGQAIRRVVRLQLTDGPDPVSMDLLIHFPVGGGRHPAFLGLNFCGNHAVVTDRDLPLPQSWFPDNPEHGFAGNRATEKSRGVEAAALPLELILARGYAAVSIYYGDIEPDHADGWKAGVRGRWLAASGKSAFAADDWGALAAWAWGLQCAVDYLQTDPDIDPQRIAVFGHSRLGKAAMWAGAQDDRIALTISNNSGEGGAALTRRCFGETVEFITGYFPHWFCANRRTYAGRENDLPIDQHELVSLYAPRPAYIASAVEDQWADPRGEFLSAAGAEGVYRLLGRTGLGTDQMPPVDQPIGQTVGYHIRSGGHALTRYDWERYLDFADRHLRGK